MELKIYRNGNSGNVYLYAGYGNDFWRVVYPGIAVSVRYVLFSSVTLLYMLGWTISCETWK